MIVPEVGSTGAEAMFVFHALDAGNGTNPFRLPRLPVLIFPHATPAEGVLITNAKLVVAVSFVGEVESITVTDTADVPTTLVVPVIAPVELLIDNPLGKPLAL
jgi:hypothetical protein